MQRQTKHLTTILKHSFSRKRTRRLRVKNPMRPLVFSLSAVLLISAFLGFAHIFDEYNASAADNLVTTVNSNGYTITLTSARTIQLDADTTSDVPAIALDTVNVKTNSDSYQLYLSMGTATSNSLHLNGDLGNSANAIAPATGSYDEPHSLDNDSWGYAIPGLGHFDAAYSVTNPSAASLFSSVPLYGSEQLIAQNESANNDDGTNLDVYYGVLATSALVSGTYSNTIVYTAVAGVDGITDRATITPNRTNNLLGGELFTIATNLTADATNIASGSISVTIGGKACVNPTAGNNGAYVVITCYGPTMDTGVYHADVELTIDTYHKNYFIANGVEYYYTTDAAAEAILAKSGITTMQDLTTAACQELPVDVAVSLRDSRDGRVYSVTHMKDGNCWMTSDLRFSGLDANGVAITMTAANSDGNPASGFALPASALSGFTGTNNNAYYDDGETAFYSWFTATAGTGTSTLATRGQNATSSICPKGWVLPRSGGSGTITTVDKSWYKLMNAYSSELGLSSYDDQTTWGRWSDDYRAKLKAAPFNLSQKGNANGTSMYTTDNISYWSATAYDGSYAYLIFAYSGGLSAPYYYLKYYGMPIRCVFDPTVYMQDTPTMRALVANLPETASTTVIDSRDANAYRITKEADGHIWMTQNLRLINKTITSADSDIASGSFTVPAHTVSGWCATSSAACDDQAMIYYDGTTDETTGDDRGALYNWYTATAGTGTYSMSSGDATSSICPKGWRLPTNGGSGTDYSWYNLLDKTSGVAVSGGQLAALAASPLYLIPAGFVNGSVGAQGSDGNYWSRTAYNSNYAYYLYFYSSGTNPQLSHNKYLGGSVRCVFDDRTYMQDTESIAALATSLSTNESETVYDKRDGNAYRVTKEADGHLWMTQNLRLVDFTGINSANTDNPLSTFTSVPASTASGWCQSNDAACDDQALAYYDGTKDSTTGDDRGALYNWFTATAGTGTYLKSSGDATGSICPKGWVLPKNGGSGTDYSWYNLLDKTPGVAVSGEQLDTLAKKPLYLIPAGLVNGSVLYQDSGGYYWSRTAYGSGNAYALRFDSSFTTPQGNGLKYGGFSVRCVFDANVMQDATRMSALLSSLSANESTTALDARDGKVYQITKMKDGNLWMTSDLRFSGKDSNGNVVAMSATNSDGAPANGFQIPNSQLSGFTGTDNNAYYDDGSTGFYSWFTATAGTGTSALTEKGTNASSSVCPAGWKLPITMSSTDQTTFKTSGIKSWYNLLNAYATELGLGTYNDWQSSGQYGYWSGDKRTQLKAAPFNLSQKGYANGTSMSFTDNIHYWSATAYSGTDAYYLGANSSSLYAPINSSKYIGMAVRCVYNS